jgi:hypothetical protein
VIGGAAGVATAAASSMAAAIIAGVASNATVELK